MKFDINKYKGNCVMHCKTKEEAADFLRVLDDLGLMWHNGDSYINPVWWENDETCYEFNTGLEDTVSYYTKNNYTILEWSDFADKN